MNNVGYGEIEWAGHQWTLGDLWPVTVKVIWNDMDTGPHLMWWTWLLYQNKDETFKTWNITLDFYDFNVVKFYGIRYPSTTEPINVIVKVNENVFIFYSAFVRVVMWCKILPNWLHWVKFYCSRDTLSYSGPIQGVWHCGYEEKLQTRIFELCRMRQNLQSSIMKVCLVSWVRVSWSLVTIGPLVTTLCHVTSF